MRITVENGLHEILAERHIRSAAELARRMAPFLGKKLSETHMTRYMHKAPPRLGLKFIEAACNALGCLPTDLFKIRIECEPDDDLCTLGTVSRKVDIVRAAVVKTTSTQG